MLTKKEEEFVRAAELAAIDSHLGPFKWVGNGRKPASRKAIALAFIAKAIWGFPTTAAIIDYLKASRNLRRPCGWESVSDMPSEATFSRAFGQSSREQLPGKVHGAMARKSLEGRIVGHNSRDSTKIEGREKAAKKQKKEAKQKKPRGRRKKGDYSEQWFTRLDLQAGRSMEENLKELPAQCGIGAKRNSKGHYEAWKGFKLHIDVADGGIPISAILTSASLHDSQAAIPLMQMSSGRVAYLYDLGDCAYDAPQIKGYSRLRGHVPIIAQNKRRGEAIPMEPAQRVRFRERGSAERVNSNLKDNYGGRFVRVRGAAKVMAHLMFGILALTAHQLFNLLE